MPGISLQNYANFAQANTQSRLALEGQDQLRTDGKRNIGNIFTRAWDCINRSSAQIEANKAISRDFVGALRAEYGKEIANTIARDLSAQLNSGRPLTGYRIEQAIIKADQISRRNQAGNQQLLRDCIDELTQDAYAKLGQNTHPGVLDRAQAKLVVSAAIRQSEAFGDHAFLTPAHIILDEFGDDGSGMARGDFARHFQDIARESLQRELGARLQPTMTQVREIYGDNAVSQLSASLPEAENFRPFEIEAYMDNLVNESLRQEKPNSPIVSSTFIGMRDHLESSIEYLRAMDDSGLNEAGRGARLGLHDDAQHMLALIEERLGIQNLSQDQLRALSQINTAAGRLEHGITEGNLQKTAEDCPQIQQSLRENLAILRAIDNNPEAAGTLKNIIQAGEQALEITEHLQQAALKGIKSADLITSEASAQQVLARFGDGGFDGPDIAWLRTQGMHVGEAAMLFTPDQVQLLKSRGMSIEQGLQYLNKSIPIHERTLLGNYVDDLVVGEPRALGGGAVSKPYDVMYGIERMVFKEPYLNIQTMEESGYGPTSKLLGIDPKNAQMTVRNIATKVIDEQLGFNLVPHTGIGSLNGKIGLVMEFAEGIAPRYDVVRDVTADKWPNINASLQMDCENPLQSLKDGDQNITELFKDYMAMGMNKFELGEFDVTDKASGQQILQLIAGTADEREQAAQLLTQLPGKIENGRVIQELRITIDVQRGNAEVNFDDPVVRRGLVQLQLLDALCAQGDRHQANYIVTRDQNGNSTGIRAIDNDQAFGTRVNNPNDLLRRVFSGGPVVGPDGVSRNGLDGFNGVMLPPVVDRSMKNAFDALSAESVQKSLEGLLPQAEIQSTLNRLEVIQQHLAQLEQNGMIIDDDAWGGEQASLALQDKNTSYVPRDKEYIGQLVSEEQAELEA